MSDPAGKLLLLNGVMSLLAFFLFGWDKLMAKLDRRRIPELALLGIAFFGGGLGAFLGMRMFRHKTHKQPFPVLVPLFLIFQVLLLAGAGMR